jgi:NADPH:quinone reductase-like Zn-dependent oxidoreductase
MQAAYVTELGPVEAIRFGELPAPAPGPTDVLLKVEAAAVNPVDGYIRSGAYRTPTPFPFVLGRDAVGVVAAVGASAAGFEVGDRVWCNSLGHGGRQGTYAEYACAPCDRVYRLPDGVDPVHAVAVLHPAATAYLGLFRRGAGLAPGATVYVAGGAGNVGDAVVRLAARAGARVVAGARREDFQRCRDAGAAVAIDYREPTLASELLRASPRGVDVFFDTSGRADLAGAVASLARGGRIVLIASAPDRRAELPLRDLYTRDGSVVGFAISNAGVEDLAAAAAHLNDLLTAGALPARVADVLPLSSAAEAQRAIEEGRAHGRRIVLMP